MNEDERVALEFHVIDTELKRRHAIDPTLSNTNVTSHLRTMSKPAQELAQKFHTIARSGNAEFRQPFEEKVEAPDRRDIEKHVVAAHDRYATETATGELNQRMGTVDKNIELNKRDNAAPPSIRDLLEAQT